MDRSSRGRTPNRCSKGQFPRSLPEVISQLQRKDQEAATNLLIRPRAPAVRQLAVYNGRRNSGTACWLTDRDACRCVKWKRQPAPVQPRQNLRCWTSGVHGFDGNFDRCSAQATPQPANNQRGPNNPRGRGPNAGGPIAVQTDLTDAQIEQNNARRLLSGLQPLLPQIDQYLSTRAPSVRQKMTELGMGDNARQSFVQSLVSMQQGNATADTLVQAASSAPPQLQSRFYQQAALKALDEGNSDRARQIASDHLDAGARDVVLERIDFRETAKKAEGARVDDLRQTLARLHSDNERIDL